MNRIERETLRAALEMVRKPDARTLAVDAPADAVMSQPGLRIIATPLDQIREIMEKHPVPREWREALERIAPPSLRVPWLTLRYLDRRERWVVDQCTPEALIPPDKKAQLAGTPYWKMPKHLRMGRQQMVSAYQWEMFRKHRVWARPLWCLQGEHGGTPALYTDMEKAILRATGCSPETPEAGSLPYAGWDNRVEQQLRERDALFAAERNGDASASAEAEKAFRVRFLSWFTETMQPQIDFLNSQSGRREADSVLRPATDGEKVAAEQLEESYIEHGVVPHAADTPLSLI